MVISTRSGFPTSFSALSLPFHLPQGSSLETFPSELLFMTFRELDIPTLLKVCNVCKRFQKIATEILSKKFNEPEVGLMLSFEQEYKVMFNVLFKFSRFDRQSGNFVFKPNSTEPTEPMEPTKLRFVHSSMVRSPVLSKVYDASSSITSTTTPDSSPTLSSSPNSSTRNKENFLEKSLALSTKPNKGIIREIRHVYRVGHGTTHLRIPYVFTYEITDRPPPSTQITRGGERWITPISFECAQSFFYPREPITHKIMNMIHPRKRNLNKKKSPPSPPSHKQKENVNVDFKEEELEGFVLIAVIDNENRSPSRKSSKVLLDQQEQEQEQERLRPLKGKKARRWILGARS